MSYCPNEDCREELDPEAKFCPECGATVSLGSVDVTVPEVLMVCPQCGAQRKQGKRGLSKFCMQCRFNYPSADMTQTQSQGAYHQESATEKRGVENSKSNIATLHSDPTDMDRPPDPRREMSASHQLGRHQRYGAGGDHDSSAFSDSLGWSPPRRHHPADPLPSTESLLTQLESYEPQKLSKPIYLEDSQYPVQRLHEFSDDVELHKSLHRTLSTPNLTRHNEEESVEGAQVYEDDHWSSDEEDYRERIEPVTEGGEQEQTTTVTTSTDPTKLSDATQSKEKEEPKDETPKFETLDVFREYQKKASEIVSNQKLRSKISHDDVDYLMKRSKKYTSLLDAFTGSFQPGKNKKVFRAKVEKLYGMTKQQLSEVKQMASSVKFDSRKLNGLFKQAGLDMVEAKKVPEMPPILNRTTRKITFRVMLSSQFMAYYKQIQVEPTVEIRDDKYKKIVSLMRSGDIWQGERSFPITKGADTLKYRYVIHDGINVAKESYECLDTHAKGKPINRLIKLGDQEDDMIVFDGIALPSPKSDVWRKTVNESERTQDYKIRGEEQERGLHAMFPSWSAETLAETSISQLIVWFNDIGDRFRSLQLKFPECYGYSSVKQYQEDSVLRKIDSAVATQIGICIDSHMLMLEACTSSWTAISSMLGLIHLASMNHMGRLSNIDIHKPKYLSMITATMDKANECLAGQRKRNVSSRANTTDSSPFEILWELLGENDQFNSYLARSVLTMMQTIGNVMWYSDAWIGLLPFIHILEKSHSVAKRGNDFSAPPWWGTARICSEIKKLQGRGHTYRENWKQWLKWLSPWFGIVPILPYTYLALLTSTQYSLLLQNTPDVYSIRYLPIDGIMAKTSIIMGSGRSNHNEIYGLFKGLLVHVKTITPYTPRSMNVGKFCKDIAIAFLGYVREKESGLIAHEGIHEAVQIALILTQDYIASYDHQKNKLSEQRSKGTEPAQSPEDIPNWESLFEELNLPLMNLVLDIYSIFSTHTWQTAHLSSRGLEPNRYSASSYRRRLGDIPDKELECWTDLFRCRASGKLNSWWESHLKHIFGSRLEEVARRDPVAIVDLYCTKELSIPAMDQTVADSAFTRAEKLIMEKRDCLFGGSSTKRKITKLVDQAMNKTWDCEDERHMTIVRNMIKWGNFLSVWKFYDHLDEDQKKVFSDSTRTKLIKSHAALEHIIADVMSGDTNFSDFEFLYNDKNSVMELCQVSFELRDKADEIAEKFDKRQAQRQSFIDFHSLVSDLWSVCSSNVKDPGEIFTWLKRERVDMTFSGTFDMETGEVICELIPQEIRDILVQYRDLKPRVVVSREFSRLMERHPIRSFGHIAILFREAVSQYEEIKSTLGSGALSIAKFDKIFEIYFSKDLPKLCQELVYMIETEPTRKSRREQITICANLDVYHSGAELMLVMKELYGLTGDFKDMENIMASKDKKLELREITDRLVQSAASIKHIDDGMINALKAFKDCAVFVEWARREVPKKDISTFVDLASGTLSEDDEAAQKTRYLINALTGYSPLIYDFDDTKETDFTQFMGYCNEVWKAYGENNRLERNLRYTATNLDWLKKVKSHFGDVELGSIAQANAINRTGVYKIGNIHNFSKQFKELDDVIQLKWEVEETHADEKGSTKVEIIPKTFTYADLMDLQSRLTLVAAEKQRDNRNIIKEFENMRDAVESLAMAYLDVRKEGCIQFDDLLIKVDCDKNKAAPVKVKCFQANKQYYTGRKVEKSALDHCNDLCSYLNSCVTKWREIMDLKRREQTALNYFTTEQIVILRGELGHFMEANEPEILKNSMPLLAMIHTAKPSQIQHLITSYIPPSSTLDDAAARLVPEYSRMSSIQQDMVDELYTEHEHLRDTYPNFNRDVVVEAVSSNDYGQPEEYVEWIKEKLTAAGDSGNPLSQTTQDVINSASLSISNRSGTLLDQLNLLWDHFVERTDHTIKDRLSVTHLGHVLTKLDDMKVKQKVVRKLPNWLARGSPALISVKQRLTYQTVLSIYECDADYTFPTRNEVLICNSQTTLEQVNLMLSRAFADPQSFYTLVNCQYLDHDICKVMEHRLSLERSEQKNFLYGLAFLYCEEVKDSKIRSYLDKYLVRNAEVTDRERITHYVQRMLKVAPEVEHTCSCVDKDRSLARLIRSHRAGVGKSYQKSRLTDKLVDFPDLNPCTDITIPIYKTIDTDRIINRLRTDLGTGYETYHSIHLDIAHEVEEGVDELLFNLVVLRSVVNSEGVVWQAQCTQYYVIECMPNTRKGLGCVHEVLDLLPTISCIAPEEALAYYNDPNTILGSFLGFDEDVLMSREWQTVLKYLDCHRKRIDTFETSEEAFTDHKDALELLIGNCGLKDPTWSELRHYVYFLSSQLFKVEKSPFCSLASMEDIPGFRKFIINFMFRMAQDFATRSLKIAEETPGIEVNKDEIPTEVEPVEGDSLLDSLTMKRTWESSNHPYLFFNEDGATVTPLGFYVKTESLARPSSLIDCQTGEMLLAECISRDLKRALDQYDMSMNENFNSLTRHSQICKLRDIMVKKCELYRRSSRNPASSYRVKHFLFEQQDDPDPNYVLTLDNAKKILAIHQRLKVEIPVIIMGETGCGKTKLIEFMSKLQVPTDLKEKIIPMIIVKIHGGTTEDDIIRNVKHAQELALNNRKICKEFADEHESVQVPEVYTMLFLDEANTTEAIGLIKEIMCDKRMRGVPLQEDTGLKIVAACNPYKRHTPAMIDKLKKAGLGYNVSEKDTKDKFGHIPMRHLVYRVQALPQSLLPLVWDFGTLPCGDEKDQDDRGLPRDVESQYIRQMLVKSNHFGRDTGGLNFSHRTANTAKVLSVTQYFMRQEKNRLGRANRGLDIAHKTASAAKILSVTQYFMRQQKDECSFVSLRDIQRVLDVSHWFYTQRENLFPAMDSLWDQRHATVKVIEEEEEDTEEEEKDVAGAARAYREQTLEEFRERFRKDHPCRCLLLALSVCYLARLEEDTRRKYCDFLNEHLKCMLGARDNLNINGADFLFEQIELCQDTLIEQVIDKENHKNIAKNKALKENVFMMIVCIENRIPLFLVGKPGSSKSLAKSLVDNATKGHSGTIFGNMKKTYMISFQCSRHATPSGIVGVFNYCANYQKDIDLDKNVAVVVLDEVGLAEDSENMPLKTLHPLLEDGCAGDKKPEPWMKCAFIGISNWALDPAKMNRGIFVQRGTPGDRELEQIAKEICNEDGIPDKLGRYISDLARGYLAISDTQKLERRQLTEFFGLRDFYSLMKMVVNFDTKTLGGLTLEQLEHSIRRNFGGFDTDLFNPMDTFREKLHNIETLPRHPEDAGDLPPTDAIGLIKSSLSGNVPALQEMETRYLLILTESLSVLSIILDEFARAQQQQPEIIFGSRFTDDVSYTQICYNINRIKTCMSMGRPVILLNLDDLYESLYDLLNQYFSLWDNRKYVHVGLGNHRVKSYVHDKFRLVVIADKHKVHTQFPIPLINRLEKHYISATSLLEPEQREVKNRLEEWALKFIKPNLFFRNVCPSHCDGCDRQLDQPYKLPCLLHFVGSCCREAMFTERIVRQCPVQTCQFREISDEFNWEIDRIALANRQYFENTSVETAFIGYSSEATALCVRKASEDLKWTKESDDNETIVDEVLEKAKYHLLQCSTGESVLRLDKTELKSEADKIQQTYMNEQYHETLHSYLIHHLPTAEETAEPLFLQVTSFAEQMNPNDVETLEKNLKVSEIQTDICSMYLKQFVKQDQFTDFVRTFYEKAKSEHTCKLLLVQCESANENTDLLDSVRYIIQRESEAIQSNTHTVLLLNLPRGHTFSGYQGGKWSCLHIDDPRSPAIKLPPLSKCMQLTPSQIVDKVSNSLSKQSEDELAEGDTDTANYDYILPFITQCLPSALSTIKSSQNYDRVTLVRELMRDNQDFMRLVLKHLHSLLRTQDEAIPGHWVKTDAAKASNMKQSETLRHALEDSLERYIIPGLAAVISFIDVRENLLILRDHSKLYPLWIDLFSHADQLGLTFEDITRANENTQSMSKLPQMYSIRDVGEGHHKFRVQFPFSWIVKETIDKIIKATPENSADLVASDGLMEQFKMTPIGALICSPRYDKVRGQMLDSYLVDFIYMSHPCVSFNEHKIVGVTINHHIRRNGIKDHSMIHIHQAYTELTQTMENLSTVMRLTLHFKSNPLTRAAMSSLSTDKRCEVLVLECVLNYLHDIKMPELQADPEGWVNLVMLCKPVMEQITSTIADQNILSDSQSLWSRLQLKKLYVEHVIIPSPVEVHRGVRKHHKLVSLMKTVRGSNFQSFASFTQVVTALRNTLGEGVRNLYPDCPTRCPNCERVLDSPVRLPCRHILCDCCVTEIQICNQSDCDMEIPEDFKYTPEMDDIEETAYDDFVKLRSRLNKFFMKFVSELVFQSEPDADVITWLAECVTFRDGTRSFSIFNYEDVVDPNPVLRSFLLKLLLRCRKSGQVKEDIDKIIGQWALTDQYKLQTMVLLMDCLKDLNDRQYDISSLSDELSSHMLLIRARFTDPSVELIYKLADMQSVLCQTIDTLISQAEYRTDAHTRLEKTLKQFIERAGKTENPQPGYMIVRQLLATSGESYVKDLINTPHNYLVPDDVRQALESFVVPDILSVYGGDVYQTAKKAFTKILTESTTGGEQFTHALTAFRESCMDVGIMLHVLFSRVTRSFTQAVPLPPPLIRVLREGFSQWTPVERNMLDLLLEEGRLPQQLDMNQTKGIHLTMLILHMFSGTRNKTPCGTVNPIMEVIESPWRGAIRFLPTMADNQFEVYQEAIRTALQTPNENPVAYRCPNGHPYVIGDCGRPYTLAQCHECGAQIGGQGHRAAAGNQTLGLGQTLDEEDRSKKGHILGRHTSRQGPAPERDLTSLSCAVLRCVLHIAMYTASLYSIQAKRQILDMIKPGLVRAEDVDPFLDAHIQLDLQHISQCCSESIDDCLLLLHDVIHLINTATNNEEEKVVLDSIEKRRSWEADFAARFIKPVFDNKDERLQDIKSHLKTSEAADLSKILSTDIEPLNTENTLASPGLWEYRRPLTLPAVQNLLQSTIKGCPNLQLVIDNSARLVALKYLPDVLTLLQSINNKYHSRYSRSEARELRVGDFCVRTGDDIPNVRELVDNFILAWNLMISSNNKGLSADLGGGISIDSHLSHFLLDKHVISTRQGRSRSAAYQLITFLTETHNRMLSEVDETQLSSIPLTSVNPTNIISLTRPVAILELIQSHLEYEVRGASSSPYYNWPAVEIDVVKQYIMNKPKIVFTREHLPFYVYKEDFNLHNQLQAIKESQAPLNIEQQTSIVAALNMRIPTLSQNLKDLQVIINFLSVLPRIERDNSLSEYMKTTFGREKISYLSDNIRLKHVRDVWLLIKYYQTDLLMKQNQAPFDDTSGDYRDDLTPELRALLNDVCLYGSPKTKLLSTLMFEFVLLRLNRAATTQNPVNINQSLRLALTEHASSMYDCDDNKHENITEDLPRLPEDLQVKHAYKAWRYIWSRHTTPV